jgi:hypothetical protein
VRRKGKGGKDRKGGKGTTYEEDRAEDDPEEPQTLLLRPSVLVAVKGVEKVDRRDQVGVDDVGREDAERSSKTGDSVTEELRGEEGEDTDSVVGGDVVVKLVGGENRNGLSGVRGGRGHDEDGDVLLDVEDAGVEESPDLRRTNGGVSILSRGENREKDKPCPSLRWEEPTPTPCRGCRR